MKIILSRKSMDSKYGGLPSPVLFTGSGEQHFFPLPIPFSETASDTTYSDIWLYDDYTARHFINDVCPGYKQSNYCHYDPDLRRSYLAGRNIGWKPAFGQLGASQTHLGNFNIGIGDVFLFFGWFQFAALVDGKFQYSISKEYPNGFHAMYGYLQIGAICHPCSDTTPESMAHHPHIQHAATSHFNKASNTVYIAADRFSINHTTTNKSGAGAFLFHPALILTQKEQHKRSLWRLPAALHPDNGVALSYNAEPFWRKENNYTLLAASPRGQEFIFTADLNGAVSDWCSNLILKHETAE